MIKYGFCKRRTLLHAREARLPQQHWLITLLCFIFYLWCVCGGGVACFESAWVWSTTQGPYFGFPQLHLANIYPPAQSLCIHQCRLSPPTTNMFGRIQQTRAAGGGTMQEGHGWKQQHHCHGHAGLPLAFFKLFNSYAVKIPPHACWVWIAGVGHKLGLLHYLQRFCRLNTWNQNPFCST